MSLTREMKLRIWRRDGLRCRYCGEQLRAPRPGEAANGADGVATIDHVIPRAKGGTNERHNLVTSCTPCNLDKADRLVESAVVGTSARVSVIGEAIKRARFISKARGA